MNWDSIGSGNGLSPFRRQAITWTNADMLSVGSLGTNFNEIQIKKQNFSFMKIHSKLLSAKWQLFRPGGDELQNWEQLTCWNMHNNWLADRCWLMRVHWIENWLCDLHHWIKIVIIVAIIQSKSLLLIYLPVAYPYSVQNWKDTRGGQPPSVNCARWWWSQVDSNLTHWILRYFDEGVVNNFQADFSDWWLRYL